MVSQDFEKRRIDLMNSLKSIDVSDIESVAFVSKSGDTIRLNTENIKRIARYTMTQMGKSTFEPEELNEVFSYVRKYIDSSLTLETFDTITQKLERFCNAGGTVIIQKKDLNAEKKYLMFARNTIIIMAAYLTLLLIISPIALIGSFEVVPGYFFVLLGGLGLLKLSLSWYWFIPTFLYLRNYRPFQTRKTILGGMVVFYFICLMGIGVAGIGDMNPFMFGDSSTYVTEHLGGYYIYILLIIYLIIGIIAGNFIKTSRDLFIFLRALSISILLISLYITYSFSFPAWSGKYSDKELQGSMNLRENSLISIIE